MTDGDTGDSISLSIRGEMSDVFTINDEGELFIKNIGYMRGQVADILITAQVRGLMVEACFQIVFVARTLEYQQDVIVHQSVSDLSIRWSSPSSTELMLLTSFSSGSSASSWSS